MGEDRGGHLLPGAKFWNNVFRVKKTIGDYDSVYSASEHTYEFITHIRITNNNYSHSCVQAKIIIIIIIIIDKL